jgi:hypothetical protein
VTASEDPDHEGVNFMATTSLPKDRRLRMIAILLEAEERYQSELMDDEERLLLRDRIIRLKTKLASLAS